MATVQLQTDMNLPIYSIKQLARHEKPKRSVCVVVFPVRLTPGSPTEKDQTKGGSIPAARPATKKTTTILSSGSKTSQFNGLILP